MFYHTQCGSEKIVCGMVMREVGKQIRGGERYATWGRGGENKHEEGRTQI